MAYQVYLRIEDEDLPLPTSYEVSFRDIEADTGGETEAGTIQRDIVRHKIASISVSFNCSPKLAKKLTSYSKFAQLNVSFFDTESLEQKNTLMYMEDLSVRLVKDTSYKSLWEVSFNLEEF